MLRVLWIVVVAAIVLAVAWLFAGLPGEISGEIAGYAFEASAAAAALAVLVLFVALYVVARLIGLLVGAPGAIRRARAEHRRRLGEIAVTRTLLALGAGEAGGARREAARSRRLLGDTPQTLLLAAEAGRLGGQEAEAEAAYRVLAADPQAAFLGLRGLLRQAIARQDWPEAARLAREAEQAHPGAAWLRRERRELAMRTGAWAEALALTDADQPKAALAAAAADADTDPSGGLRLAKQAWDEDPGLTQAALAYARRLRETGRTGRAFEVIRRAWATAPHPDLAAFIRDTVTSTADGLAEAKRLAQENPNHPESHITVARAALDAGDLGLARREAEAARDAGFDQRRLWLLFADIAEAEGEDEQHRAAQRDALRYAAAAPPDPVWRCGECGTELPSWRPSCPHCGTPGRVEWTQAARRAPMPKIVNA
jgi:HemY protein